jgi:hypothetical protein
VTKNQPDQQFPKKGWRIPLEGTNRNAINVTLSEHHGRSHVFVGVNRIISLVFDEDIGKYIIEDYFISARAPRVYTNEIWDIVKNNKSKPMFWLLHAPEDIKENQNEETIGGFQGFTGKESEEQYLNLNSHLLGWKYQNEITQNLLNYPNYHHCQQFRTTPTLEYIKKRSLVTKYLPTIGRLHEIDPALIINFPRDLKNQKIMHLALNPKWPSNWGMPLQKARLCLSCKKVFDATDDDHIFCTTKCRVTHHRRNKALEERTARQHKECAPRCVVCGGLLSGRSDAETCGDQCRQRKCRADKKKI